MPVTFTPYGFVPTNQQGTKYDTNGIETFQMPTNSSNGIYANDLVNITAGSPSRVAAAPTAGTVNANTPTGWFAGAEYIDPTGFMQYVQWVPPNAVTNGYTSVRVKVATNPDQRFKILANGTVALTSIDQNINVGGFTAPTAAGTIPLFSAVYADTTTIGTTNTLPFRIVGVLSPSDAYSEIVIAYNFGTHAYQQATGR